MKRLFDEERAGIACQKTLGFHDGDIVKRYVFFVFIATVIGGLVAFPVGYGLTSILYTAFNLQYKMMPLPLTLNFKYYALTFLIIIISAVVTTLISGFVSVKDKPTTLLQPKAPKIGKKTFLEHIPFVWNKLSFKYKSTLRNVFLFKSRFFMTVISVLGSAVLLFAGFGLMDNAFKIKGADMLITISLALVAFSAVLCALVIYNITNINTSERTREIATLMVLGYQGREVAGYIFREIYIMCMISALLGLPVGALFINYAFNFIDFGSLANVNWWTYVLTPMITMLFGFMSTRLLRKKITSIDMNASLKSLE
jgi:putative ABC transport system permease protein